MKVRRILSQLTAAAAIGLLSVGSFAEYDSGSTSNNILKSCKNFGSKWNTNGNFELTMDCNTMVGGVLKLIASGSDLDNAFGNNAGTLTYNNNGTYRDFSDSCIQETISSSTTAVTLSARCDKGIDGYGCQTLPDGSISTHWCPATSINVANHITNPVYP